MAPLAVGEPVRERPAAMVIVGEMLAVLLLLSVTVIVIGKAPDAVGVPGDRPVAELSVRPAGREPLVRTNAV